MAVKIGSTSVRSRENLHRIFKNIQSDLDNLRDVLYEHEYVIDEYYGNSDINIKTAMKNMSLSSGAIAIATTVQKVKSTATINYLINGVYYSKAATDNFWVLTGFDCSASMYNKCLLCIDDAGAMQIAPGTEAAAAADVVLPAIPANWAVCGYVQVQQSAGGAFTGGTTGLNDATTTDTYVNMAFHPDQVTEPVSVTPTYMAALLTTQE